jgi:hypothetical protein
MSASPGPPGHPGARVAPTPNEVQTTTGRDAISPCRTRAAASNSPDQLGAYITLQPRNTADRGPLAPRRSTVEAHERQRDRPMTRVARSVRWQTSSATCRESRSAASDASLGWLGSRIIRAMQSSAGRLRPRAFPEVDRAGGNKPATVRAGEPRRPYESPINGGPAPLRSVSVREVSAAAPGGNEFNIILTLRRSARCCHITGTACIKAPGGRESQWGGWVRHGGVRR